MTGNQENEAALFPHVIHFPLPPQFVMLFCLNARGEDGDPARSGIYAAFSDDGIAWPKERFLQVWKVPVLPKIGRRLAWHPTFVPDDVGDWLGWLYYGYSETWGHGSPHEPHHLMRRPLSFTMSRAPHQGANERAPALDP
ncbi:MAG TPA: hypothetical protein PLU30_19335 [Verrucomicrobiae bacterium]|mgnify:CR=1 FL=1|nr:hypothetical protein [Verrucomicrobiae bacterium]